MCISDWRIGRLIAIQATPINVAAGTGVTYLPNQQRVAITVSAATSAISLSNCTIVTFDNGTVILVPQQLGIVHMTTKDYGRLVQKGFTITQLGSAIGGAVTEYFLPEGVLTESIDAHNRDY